MAIHFSILAWRIPWTEELGGPRSDELQSQTQWSNEVWRQTHTHETYPRTRSQLFKTAAGGGNGTLVFLPGIAMDRRAWWATVHGIAESNTTVANTTAGLQC